MKFILFSTIFFCLTSNKYSQCNYLPFSPDAESGITKIGKDTNKLELDEFKKFTKKFFEAIEREDTAYLKKHILFPISNSSFYLFDHTIDETKKIDSKIFFRRLHKFFPGDLIYKIGQAEYSISEHKDFQTKYIITLYEESGGVESNYAWVFILMKRDFYFTNFRTEAG